LFLLTDFIFNSAKSSPTAPAICLKDNTLTYQQLATAIDAFARALICNGLRPNDRVAIYLPKQFETVIALFGTALAGGIFVPINPLLKPKQVSYILNHCQATTLITASQRTKILADELENCPSIQSLVLADKLPSIEKEATYSLSLWNDYIHSTETPSLHSRIDQDTVSILYTSGSTGQPKGVSLSHRNMVEGAKSVASYLNNTDEDRLLAVLPFSFDYGLSQLTTAFSVGACAYLMDYLLPNDVIKAVAKYKITGLAAVPPLWNQLCDKQWPDDAVNSLRYITNSGGAVPTTLSKKLQACLPKTDIVLMYGLTEAFRSTYLPPEQLAIRPESMGKPIPNADLMVVRADGSECDADEPGELVHRGSLVAQGYWNDIEKTQERFKLCPSQLAELPLTETAVWSGDIVKKDSEGYFYFLGRNDEMIKTSGYRVSPGEIEEIVHTSDLIHEAAAIGLAHPTLGQAILLVYHAKDEQHEANQLLSYCKQNLPLYMVPHKLIHMNPLPKNANGKIDRSSLKNQHLELFNNTNT
jgi:acyl-CoA ligase (AMP-forming) (exosortase A-associated)